jgi:hypothetical protein
MIKRALTISRAIAVGGVLALVLAACSSAEEGVTTYTDPDRLSLIKVPSEWHLYESDETAELESTAFTADIDGLPIVHSVAFDGAPTRDPENIAAPFMTATYPVGASIIRSVGEEMRDVISRRLLAQVAVPYQGLEITPQFQEDFEFAEGFDGVRQLATYTDPASGDTAAVYLISVTDDTDEQVYSVAVGCSVECFIDNQDQIVEVVDSWLVNVRS